MDDFTDAAIRQARFYLYGIFKGEKHPLDAHPRRKLHPLQKITYLALLNILLPFQIVTGLLMWGPTAGHNCLTKSEAFGFWAQPTQWELTYSSPSSSDTCIWRLPGQHPGVYCGP
jgi:thiosulfate reductase cytochrome b subunit